MQHVNLKSAIENLLQVVKEHYNATSIPLQANLRYCGFVLASVLPFLVVFSFIVKNRYRNDHLLETRQALEALLAVIVPKASRWPARYISIAKKSTRTRRNRSILLPLPELLDDIASGTMELRDSNTLAELIGGRMRVYGCLIRLHVHMAWRIKVLSLMLSWYTHPVPSQVFEIVRIILLGD
jgi:hypothetical protein